MLTLLELDAVDEATVAADDNRSQTEQRGGLSRLAGAHFVASVARFYAGRWDDALAELEAGQAVMDDIGNAYWANYYSAVVAKVAIHRGDLATAKARLTAGMQKFREGVNRFGADWLFGTQAEFLAATGQADAALKVAEANWTHTAVVRYVWGHRGRGISVVRLAVAAGRDELARSVTADLEEGARRSPAASATGAALLCRGLVERDPDQALAAVPKYRQTPLRPDLAACCEHAAAVVAAAGRREEAITLLRRQQRSTPRSMPPPMRPGSTPPCASSGSASPGARRHGRRSGGRR